MGFIPGWAIGGAVIIFASALAKIILAKTRASVPTLPSSDGASGELRQAIDAMQNRLGELEERVDFAERLLAKQRETERLAPPST
jgi:hypothetical protein